MISTEEFSRLLATLYAAPLQPEKWQVFFDHLSQLTKITSGHIISGNPTQGYEALAGGGMGYDPEVNRLYNEHYIQFDPFMAPGLSNPRVAVIRGPELVSQRDLLRSGFYNDLLAHFDMEHQAMLTFGKTEEHLDVMPFWRRKQDGPLEDECIALLEMLLPHVQAALQIRSRLKAAEMGSQFGAIALEALSTAAFLVTETGRVLHRNQRAAALLLKGDGLRLERRVLTARHPGESALLMLFMAGAAKGNRRGDQPPGGVLRVTRQGTQAPLHLSVISAPDASDAGPGMMSGLDVPCALVLVTDPTAVPRSRAASMRALYALTPAEARLADLVLQGMDVAEAATHLRTTVETTRFQMKRILSKTGARRQSELMRLMLSLPG